MLKSIKIIGLFNDRNILLNFKDNGLIITGENGSGKTHIINIIFYFLKKKFSKLTKLNFNSIIFTFESKRTIEIEITKSMLNNYVDIIESDFRPPAKIARLIPNIMWQRIVDSFKENQDTNELIVIAERFLHQRGRTENEILEINNIIKNVFSVNINQYFNKLYKYLNLFIKNKEIIYLPTYRRIEKDIKDILDFEVLNDRKYNRNSKYHDNFSEIIDNKIFDNFGMTDINYLLNKLTSDIDKTFKNAYLIMSAQTFSSLVNIDDLEEQKLPNYDIAKLVLNRLGSEIKKDDKQKALQLIKAKKKVKKKYKQLIFFINELVRIYENLKDKEVLITNFKNVCNKYLQNKKFVFDKNQITISLENDRTKKEISLDYLSSGEKQIVSLFAQIYLKTDKHYIIFFDEPELSLSLEWQKMLLNDIYNSKRCASLFVATHSPYIFHTEELFNKTVDMEEITSDYTINK